MLLKLLPYIAVGILIPDHVLPDETVPCEAGWHYFKGKCFKANGGTRGALSWFDAVNYCIASRYGILATIESPEENDFLIGVLLLEIEGGAWIGLTDQRKENSFEWLSETKSTYRNWRESEPNGGSRENCALLTVDLRNESVGTWVDLGCNRKMGYVCETKFLNLYANLNPKYCSSADGGGFRMRKACYHLVTEMKSWEEAEQHCSDNYAGHLITVLDKTVDYYLNYLYPDIRDEFWIGLKIQTPFQQQWSSGWYAGYNGFKEKVSNFTKGTCAVRIYQKEWDMVPCSNKYPFICEKLLEKPPVLKPPSKDFICPNAPTGWRDLGGEYCYHIEASQKVSWDEAKSECVLRGGHLLSLHSKEESEVLRPFIHFSPTEFYIGLVRSDKNKAFKWSDGSRLDYKNWEYTQPDNGDHLCVNIMPGTMQWDDVDCSKKRHYICAVEKIQPSTIVTVEISASPNSMTTEYIDNHFESSTSPNSMTTEYIDNRFESSTTPKSKTTEYIDNPFESSTSRKYTTTEYIGNPFESSTSPKYTTTEYIDNPFEISTSPKYTTTEYIDNPFESSTSSKYTTTEYIDNPFESSTSPNSMTTEYIDNQFEISIPPNITTTKQDDDSVENSTFPVTTTSILSNYQDSGDITRTVLISIIICCIVVIIILIIIICKLRGKKCVDVTPQTYQDMTI